MSILWVSCPWTLANMKSSKTDIAPGQVTHNSSIHSYTEITHRLPGGSVVNNPPAHAGAMGLISDPGRSHMSQSN